MPTRAATNSTATPRFSSCGASPASGLSRATPPRACCSTNQSESQSAGRVVFSSKKRYAALTPVTGSPSGETVATVGARADSPSAASRDRGLPATWVCWPRTSAKKGLVR